jgi:glycosyltransferase involved in cell wall biosynthesis
MNRAFLEHFCCPETTVSFRLIGDMAKEAGYFQFGKDVICFGQACSRSFATKASDKLEDLEAAVQMGQNTIALPFDLDQVVDNLRYERYASHMGPDATRLGTHPLIRDLYYLARPYLSVTVRRVLQRIRLRSALKTPFPHWPVDRTVDRMFEKVMGLAIRAGGNVPIPFIWFWPDGAKAALLLTHDVESPTGLDFCPTLMDLDNEFGFYASFQLVPEKRYTVTKQILESIKNRGFEVNVHDLNHDGHLFREREEFLRRASKINEHAILFGTSGFRSGALYRNLNWYDALRISYDMSVPNVGHLDPQSGGCCTTLPYFIGDIIELPVTETQDYSLFHILNKYSIDLWKQQTEIILRGNGLISFIVHPDYVIEKQARNTYRALLAYLAEIRTAEAIWSALPAEIARWWKLRRAMRLVRSGEAWQIVGDGKERAKIAYAYLEEGQVRYSFDLPFPKCLDSIAWKQRTEHGMPIVVHAGEEFSDGSTQEHPRLSAGVEGAGRGSVSEAQTQDEMAQPMKLLQTSTSPSESAVVDLSFAKSREAAAEKYQPSEQTTLSGRRPSRVCMVAYTFYELDNRVMRYAETLAKRGDRVDVFALRREGTPVEESLHGVRVTRLQGRVIDEKGRFSHLWRILLFLVRSMIRVSRNDLKQKYDFIHVHSVPDFLVFSALLPRLRGTPVILDIHDILPEFYASKFGKSDKSLMFRFLHFVEWFCAKFSSHVIIANHIWQERLLSRSVSSDKCTVVLNFPDRSIFSRGKEKSGNRDRFLLLYPGTLNWHQGLDVAVRAFARISSKVPQADFHIYGEGPSKPDLQDLVKQHHLESRVFIHPRKPLREIAEVVESADLGIVPKRKNSFGNEAFSTKIFEFMAMGVPVIVSDTLVDRYYFDDSVVRFFRGGDEEDLARCMLDLIQHPEKRQSLVRNASVFIDQNDWAVKKQEYLNLVDNLIARANS